MSGHALEEVERGLRARPRRWLITGAAGFVGSHLVGRLLALGQEVRGLDDFSTGRRENLAALRRVAGEQGWKRFTLLEGDVCDPAAVRAACAGIELVLHQAALGSVPRSLAEPGRCVRVNVQGTWTVLAAARAAGSVRAVLASSSSVYGDCERTPQREDRIGRPLSPYAASKRAAELVAEGLARGLAFPVVALRYFNVFGPRQDPAGPYAAVVPRWSRALLRGEAPVLFGDGQTTRDFTPVAAVVDANLLAACVPLAAPAPVVNVGTGRETSLRELHRLLVELCAARGLERGALQPVPAPGRPHDRRSSRADLARARELLGYEPPASLLAGLGATLDDLVDSGVGAS